MEVNWFRGNKQYGPSSNGRTRLVSRQRKPAGFTLIELLFAMTAFIIMLVVAVSGLLNAMLIYSQASVSRDNQQEVRAIVEQIGRDIRSATQVSTPTADRLCIETATGNWLYYLDGTTLKKDNAGSCVPYNPAVSPNPASLTPPGLKVAQWAPVVLTQPPVLGIQVVKSVQITLKAARGSDTPQNSVRERQFSNEFSLTSSFLLRSRQ